MSLHVDASVKGARATLRELRNADRSFYYKTQGRMRKAAEPLRAAVEGSYPAGPPLSGFDHNGRTGWNARKRIVTKLGGRRGKRGWPLVRIMVTDAPRILLDLARGRLEGPLRRYGEPVRIAYDPGAELRRETVNNVEAAIREASREANRKLTRVR